MNKDESSLTSLISAFSRAYHSHFDTPKIFDDYLAKKLITQQEFNDIQKNMVQGIQFFNKEIAVKLNGQTEELLKWIVQTQLSPTPLARSAYCEKVLLNEIKLGLQQYVILGAGLDTFSLRHPELENNLKIFEIDHPATQEFKKKRLAEVKLKLPRNVHFVSLDFTKKFSYQKLMNSGFGNKKTFFSLLGVSYYLTKDEISSLIDLLFASVPTGSSIVLDYADEKLFNEQGISNRVDNMVKMAAASGEPMKSCFTYKEMEKMLENSGLLIYEHLSPETINELYFNNRKDYLTAFETIHYVHAVKK
ncbi:class I SAM-dependent methyltransferase [Lysinibacillus sp. Ag94]|uniref:class I SAM-dependent methyltransferase n=1 Tax=Lysinibacillus sp. Ag94 TaxID=2936682 RepID=UPI00200F5270|nr:class I SAM-dependent methyltransferase [Lysinibacillus sp. Ag94]UPW81468.1 class I SAM-dependent methyltransferase [Lysinibacillus sp. Ag94]